MAFVKNTMQQLKTFFSNSDNKNILAILVFIALFCIFILPHSVGWDEVKIYEWITTWSFTEIFTNYNNPGNHIFHTACMKFLFLIFPHNLITTKIASVVIFCSSAPYFYNLLRKNLKKEKSLFITLTIFLAPFLLLYGVSTRGYIYQFSLYIICIYYFLNYLETKHKSDLIKFTILLFISFYILPTTIMFIPVFFFFFILKAKSYQINLQNFYHISFALLICALLVILVYYFPVFNSERKSGSFEKEFVYTGNLASPITSMALFWEPLSYFDHFSHHILSLMGYAFWIGLLFGLWKRNPLFLFSLCTYLVFIAFGSITLQPARVYTFCLPWILLPILSLIYDILIKIFDLLPKKLRAIKYSFYILPFFWPTFTLENKLYENLADSAGINLGTREMIQFLKNDLPREKLLKAEFIGNVVSLKYEFNQDDILNKIEGFRENDYINGKKKYLYLFVRYKKFWTDSGPEQRNYDPELYFYFERKRFRKIALLCSDPYTCLPKNFTSPKLLKRFTTFELYELEFQKPPM